MKITAIRAAEFGPFTSPVALEGLSGGFNVLPGPNERGKTSLFNALQLVLTTKYDAKRADIRAFGDSPLVEAEFEVGQLRLTVRKRFLAQASAELREHASGRVLRGADAENRLEQLLGLAQVNRYRELVWVAQTRSFTLPVDDRKAPKLAPALMTVIEAETAGAAGEGLSRLVAQRALTARGKLITPGRAQPTGTFKSTLARRDDLKARHAEATAKAALARDKVAERQVLEQRHAALETQLPQLTAHAAQIAARLAEVQRDRERLQALIAREETATAAARETQNLQRAYLADVAEEQRLANEMQALVSARATTAAALAAIDARQRSADASLQDINARFATARSAVADARRHEQAQAAHQRADDLAAKCEQARQLSREHAALVATCARAAVDPASLAHIEKLDADIRHLHAQAAAAQTTAEIAYAAAPAAPFVLDGQHLAAGAVINVDRTLLIEVPGIGSIRIMPGADAAKVTALLAEAQSEQAARLATVACASVAALRDRLRQAEAARQAARLAEQRLADLAPDGVDALAARAADAKAALTTLGVIAQPAAPLTDLERALADIEAEKTEIEAQGRAAATELKEATRACAEQDAAIARIGAVLATIEHRLPPVAERSAHEATLAAAATEAQARLATATHERLTTASVVVDERAYLDLRKESERAAQALANAQAERERSASGMASINGFLLRHAEEGVEAGIDDLAVELAAIEARVADLQCEADALDLIAKLLAEAEAQRRSQLFAPVLARLTPLLSDVIPDLTIEFEDALTPAAQVARNGRNHRHDVLSDGTREQLAVLVRLAYAGLLADQGKPLPVILDDALVYSDDARLAAMAGVLARAAAHHQVIVLTCHEQAFAPLIARHGATRLDIVPWIMERALQPARTGT